MGSISLIFRKLSLLVGLVAIIGACEKDGPEGVQSDDDRNEQTTPADSGYQGASGVYIQNEGTFNYGNASLSFFQPGKGEIKQEYFKSKNGRSLGDVFHSMNFHQGKAFLVINNSGKIEVVDSPGFQSLGTIRNLPSPRYLMPLGNGKAYVTNFTQSGQSAISIVDLASFEQSGRIETGGWTEAMVKAQNRVFVAEVNLGGVLVIDPEKHTVKDTIKLQKQVQALVKDQNGKIWTLSNGGLEQERKPVLYRIDPKEKAVINAMTFPEKSDNPGSLKVNAARDSLFYLAGGLYGMPIQAGSLPNEPVIPKPSGLNFYSIGLDPYSNRIYVGEALDYVQRGRVFIYQGADAEPVDTVKAGVIPSGFQFAR